MNLKWEPVLLKSIYALIAVVIGAQALGMRSVASGAFYGVMVLTVAFWLKQASRRLSRQSLLAVFVVLLACFNVLLDMLMHMELLQGSDIVKIASFVLALLYFTALTQYRASLQLVTQLFRLNTVIAVFSLGMCIVSWERMHLFNGIVTRYLTLGFSNPNTTALFLLCCTLTEMIYTTQVKGRIFKLLHVALSVSMIFLLWQTGSRNCIIALMAYLGMLLWNWLFIRQRRFAMPRWVMICVVLIPILLAAVYMLVIYAPGINRIFDFMVSQGKQLDSRYRIWKFAWSIVEESPLIGSFSQVLHGSKQFHVHNSHLDILASYGLPVLLLFCLLEYRIMFMSGRHAVGKTSQLALWGFAALMLTGMGEVAIFSGGLGIYAYVGLFLVAANQAPEGEKQ